MGFDGMTIVAGAPFGSPPGFRLPGRAFTWVLNGSTWDFTGKIVPSSRQDNAFFGTATAVDGDFMAISAPGEDSPLADSGAVYVFERIKGAWVEVARLTASDAVGNDSFGDSLAIDGDMLLVGAFLHRHGGMTNAGAVYVFERSGAAWNEVAKLTASDPGAFEGYGNAVALVGDTAVIGTPGDDRNGFQDMGAAYIVQKVAGTWQEVAKLTASDPLANGDFGRAVAFDGNRVVVGSTDGANNSAAQSGGAYVFELSGGVWQETTKLISPDADERDFFGGESVSVEGNTIVVGAFVDDNVNGEDAGAIYVFRHAAGFWSFREKVLAPQAGRLSFGWRVALSGDRVIAAAPFFRSSRGAIYTYTGLEARVRGDVNCDDTFNGADIDPFFLALGDPAAYFVMFPNCNIENADMNCDQAVNGADIDRFFDCLAGINCNDCNANGLPDDDCENLGPLTIVTQPQSTEACAGDTVTLSVTSREALRFQWRKNGADIPGATFPDLVLRNVTVASAGDYDVLVADACVSLISETATLTVRDVAAINQQPQDADLCVGDPLLLSVAATGFELSFQWLKDGTPISGATQSTYSVGAVTRLDAGIYRVEITNLCGRTVSDSATVTVVQTIFTHPASQTVCENDPVVFVVGAAGQSLTYQWRKDGVNIAGATESFYVIAAVTMSDAGVYDVVVTSVRCQQISDPATLTVQRCP